MSGALVGLPGSPAFRQVIDRRLLSSLWFGWCFCYLPCGPTPGLSLACWLFHRFFSPVSSLCAFLDSGLLYSLADYLVLGSSFPVLVICSFLLSEVIAVASGSCFSAPLVCFILLSTHGLSLVSVSWELSRFQGFISSFSDLGFSRSQSGLGLQLFLVFLSFPLLGFPVISSPCGVSRFPTWSLFLSVPRFLVTGWFVLRPLRWCSAVSSCSSAFSRLACPFYFSSPALSFALFLWALLFEFSSYSPLVL